MNFLILLLLLVVLFVFVGWIWIRERRYLKKKTSEAMSQGSWHEIVEERETAFKKRRLFRAAMEEARRKSKESS